jgi:hypothetical protein
MNAQSTAVAQLDAAACFTVTRALKAATFPDTGNVQDSCIVFAEVSLKQIRLCLTPHRSLSQSTPQPS